MFYFQFRPLFHIVSGENLAQEFYVRKIKIGLIKAGLDLQRFPVSKGGASHLLFMY
jgi:hypothetical protein